MHELGIGAEVISPFELWLAERLGLPGERILYNGVDKSEESIERAVRLNVLSINIDHIQEIDRIHKVAKEMKRKVRVGVRLGLGNLPIRNGTRIRGGARSLQALGCHSRALGALLHSFQCYQQRQSGLPP